MLLRSPISLSLTLAIEKFQTPRVTRFSGLLLRMRKKQLITLARLREKHLTSDE